MNLVDEIDKDLRKDYYKYYAVLFVGIMALGFAAYCFWDYRVTDIKSQCEAENLSTTQCSTIVKLMKNGVWGPNSLTFDEALVVVKK